MSSGHCPPPWAKTNHADHPEMQQPLGTLMHHMTVVTWCNPTSLLPTDVDLRPGCNAPSQSPPAHPILLHTRYWSAHVCIALLWQCPTPCTPLQRMLPVLDITPENHDLHAMNNMPQTLTNGQIQLQQPNMERCLDTSQHKTRNARRCSMPGHIRRCHKVVT
jgi:hypothetical protein